MDEGHITLLDEVLKGQGVEDSEAELLSGLFRTFMPVQEEGDRVEGNHGLYAERREIGEGSLDGVYGYDIKHTSDPNSRFPLGYAASNDEMAVRQALDLAAKALELGMDIGYQQGYRRAKVEVNHALKIPPLEEEVFN